MFYPICKLGESRTFNRWIHGVKLPSSISGCWMQSINRAKLSAAAVQDVKGLTRVKNRKQRCRTHKTPTVKVVSRSGTRRTTQPPGRQHPSDVAASHTSLRLTTLLYSSHTLSCCTSGASEVMSHRSPAQ